MSEADGADPDAPDQPATTRASLDVLDRQQDRLLYSTPGVRDGDVPPLVDGFGDLWEAVIWYQASTVRTLGHVADVLEPAQMLSDRRTQEALVNDRPADRYLRHRLVERVDQACNLAYRSFHERAQERVSEDDHPDEDEIEWSSVQPDEQRHIGMRPAFTKIDEVQATKLAQLQDGFDDRTALSRWVRGLRPATSGRLDDELIDDLLSSRSTLAALLDRETAEADARTREWQRLQFACVEVLPGYVAAARQLDGSERFAARQQENFWNKPRTNDDERDA